MRTELLDFLNTFLLGAIVGASGILLLLAKDEPPGWELRFVPVVLVAVGALAVVQFIRWRIVKRLPNQRVQLTGNTSE